MNHKLVLKAALFAAQKHCHQRRKDADASPYINHPLNVAYLVAEIGGVNDPEHLAAALLHDTLEDTETSPEELEAEFGPRVRRLVEEVTDDKRLPKAERKRQQVARAATISGDAALIKLGDKISNIRDIAETPPVHWTIERRLAYLNWAEAVIAGCGTASPRLEQCFREALAEGRQALLQVADPASRSNE